MDQPVTPLPRYQGVLEEMQMLAQRLLIFGMHVHVGIEDRAFAVDSHERGALHAAPHPGPQHQQPLLERRKTGLKSYRALVFEDFPRSGIPETCRSVADWDNMVRHAGAHRLHPRRQQDLVGLRPHHNYPTLEFRICDICTRVDEAIAIAALFQAIVLWLWKLRRKNITFRTYRKELIEENRWRAARYGLDGKMIDFGKTQELPTRQLIRELLEMVGEEIDELGTAPLPAADRGHAGPRHQRRPPTARL